MKVDLFDPESESWLPPSSFPDLTGCERIAIDLETRDPNLTTLGPGWCRDDGYVIGYAVAAGDFVGYFPVRHESGNLPEEGCQLVEEATGYTAHRKGYAQLYV